MSSLLHRCARIGALSLPLLLAVPGCSDDVDQPTDADYDDIAQGVAPLVTHDLAADGTLAVSIDLAAGDAPSFLQAEANGTLSGAFGGLSWDVSITCRDALGDELPLCGETTDSASLSLSLTGSLETERLTASVDIGHDCAIEGLQGDAIEATGETHVAANTRFTGLFHPIERSFELDYDASYDVTVPRDDPAAAQGAVAASVDARRNGSGPNGSFDRHFAVAVDVELPGDGTAILSLDGVARYRLDLETGALIKL